MKVNNILQKIFIHSGYKIVRYKKSFLTQKEQLLAAFGVYLDPVQYDFCYRRSALLLDLKHKRNATLRINGAGTIELSFDDIHFNIHAADEIYIIHEVFIKGVYNYSTNEDFLFIDIGMNIGSASLCFSNHSYCKKIIAFEPFEKTIQAAKNNLALNPRLAGKIEIRSTGLGYPARMLQVPYTEKHKGTVGIHGVAANENAPEENAALKISDVYNELKIFIDEKNTRKVIKIDCEGAEYEIMERFDQMNCINSFDVYMIEWHIHGPQQIKDLLIKNDFAVHSIDEFEKGAGMIYAYKKMNPRI